MLADKLKVRATPVCGYTWEDRLFDDLSREELLHVAKYLALEHFTSAQEVSRALGSPARRHEPMVVADAFAAQRQPGYKAG